MPQLIGLSLYRLDMNFRESAVIGIVGAGGVGQKLQASPNVLAWPQVTVILVMIPGTVVVSEWVSARMRRAII